ncbi:MAG: FkbM family methyltransferase [Deltaproteobacteria bacterium]|nr:FkbM family methyltransferase [Deltaproteobacteria bacterium]
MRTLDRIRKPEYFFRPSLLIARLTRSVGRGYRVVTPSWKLSLAVDPAEEIGRALVQMGVYDLPVSEAIWRLLDPGEQAIDVGANIGYITSIMAAKAGTGGRVIAFEPHPELFPILEGNIFRWRKFNIGAVRAHQVALSNRVGRGTLHTPDGFEQNRGLASLNESGGSVADVPVEVSQLDRHVENDEAAAILKVDVEGHELQVFQGSAMLLTGRRVRDIVFEEFRDYPTPVTAFLEQFGYAIYQLGMTFWGPILANANAPYASKRQWVARSMLATLDSARARKRLAPRGWQILRPKVLPAYVTDAGSDVGGITGSGDSSCSCPLPASRYS